MRAASNLPDFWAGSSTARSPTELASRVADFGAGLVGVAYRGILLSVAAMAVRNALVLGLLSPAALVVSGATLGLMLIASTVLAFSSAPPSEPLAEDKPLQLTSPFSLRSALKFGVIFLLLKVAGTLAQSLLGHFGFYAVSALGGIVSSASAVAVAAALASAGKITPVVAGVGAILASLASAGVNVLLVARFARSPQLVRRVWISIVLVMGVGLAGAVATAYLAPR